MTNEAEPQGARQELNGILVASKLAHAPKPIRDAIDARVAYSVQEAAQMLGVSRAWLYERWANGDGPPRCRVGSRILIPANFIREWLAAQSVVQTKRRLP